MEKEQHKREGYLKMENNKAYILDEQSGKKVKYELDMAVYAVIKSYMNKDSRKCFPSIETIESKLGISKSTISKSIKRLQELKEISVKKDGKKNIYYFPYETESWKKINYEFLDIPSDKLSAMEKGLMIMLRQYFYENTNEINLSIRGLAQRLGIPHRTFNDRIQELMKKGLVTKGQLKINTHQPNRFSLQFNMDELKLELDQVNKRVDKVEAKIEEHDNKYEMLLRRIEELENQKK